MGWGSVACALVNLNFARFLNIFIVSKLVNRTRSDDTRITGKQQFVMWIAGLRGAMAYALALDSSKEGESGKVMLIITLLYALFTILGVSSFLNPIMEKCQVTNSDPSEGPVPTQSVVSFINRNTRVSRFKRIFANFDKYYFSPLFIKDEVRVERRDNEKREKADDKDWAENTKIIGDQTLDKIGEHDIE